jgi:23S rRNA pseudouridine1911/1915/1917 synthase
MSNPASSVRTFTVLPEEAGLRLDRYLAEKCPDRSRSAIARLVDEGRVKVGAESATKAGLALRTGEVVSLDEPAAPVATGNLAEAIPLNIVYRDDHLAVIDKPSGLVVHPAPGHASGTLVNALLHWAEQEDVSLDIDDEVRPGLVHRIDKDTSGLLVVAFDDATLRGLQAKFATHDIERVYRAVVLGQRIAEQGTLTTPYGRHPKDRKRFTGRLPSAPRQAVTHWRVIKRGAALALVEVKLETGRTHQIRVHLSEHGHPIIADPIYGHAPSKTGSGTNTTRINLELRAARVMPRLALHAAVLGFVHPITGERLRFESKDPDDFATLVAALT